MIRRAPTLDESENVFYVCYEAKHVLCCHASPPAAARQKRIAVSPASGIEPEEQIQNQIGSVKMSTPASKPEITSKYLHIHVPSFCSLFSM
jgi:hypothetical protein